MHDRIHSNLNWSFFVKISSAQEQNSRENNILPVYIGNTSNFHQSVNKFTGHLSSFERNRSRKFIHSLQAENYILSHYFLRLELAKILALAPKKLQIEYPHGKKPFLAGFNLDFSISHSQDFFAIAISDSADTSVGVDIEKINTLQNYDDVSNDYFHEDEKKYIRKHSFTDQLKRIHFLEIWTRKEAFLKMTGLGLTNQLSKIIMTPQNNIISIDIPDDLKIKHKKAHIYTMKDDRFILSLSCSDIRTPVIHSIRIAKSDL